MRQDRLAAVAPEAGPDFDPPFEVVEPVRQTLPIVFNSPHSGRIYPDSFLQSSQLDSLTLRRSEDAFVDDLFAAAPEFGAPLLKAHFPRAYCDVNREAWELDPSMFGDPLPNWVNTRSLRVAGGLGTIARVVYDGAEIYADKMPFSEAEHRIHSYYEPYHAQLKALLDRTLEQFGCAIMIDCHSMPSIGGPLDRDPGSNRADFVLGDRYGTACAPLLTQAVAATMREPGHMVVRNAPYAGGYCTEHYGHPERGIHALQIEINRSLYMDEERIEPSAGFNAIRALMTRVMDVLTGLRLNLIRP